MLKSKSESCQATVIMMLADLGERVPVICVPRVEEIFPELWQNGVVHVAQTHVKEDINADEQVSTSQIMPAVGSKEIKPIIKAAKLEEQDVVKDNLVLKAVAAEQDMVRDDLVLKAIAANKNRPLYNPHICPVCNMTLKNKGRLMMHLETHVCKAKSGRKKSTFEDTKKENETITKNVNDRNRKYSCNFCGQVHSNVEDLVSHKITHFEEKHACPECDLIFRTTIYLNIHIESVHSIATRKYSSEKIQEKTKKPTEYMSQAIKRKIVPTKLVGKIKGAKHS